MKLDTGDVAPHAHVIDPPAGLWWRRFMIRLRAWEYWPVYIFNFPVLAIWLRNAIRARDIFFFTLTNPGIETGGFFGESKSSILANIPNAFKPKTVLLKAGTSEADLRAMLTQHELTFPIIAKPEVGERGWLIGKMQDEAELIEYARAHPIDLILQTYIDWPTEVSIMTYAMPDGSGAAVTSICEKHFLQICGDGRSTLGQLILAQDRALLQFEKLVARFGHRWNEILPEGEVLVLEHVGNHCRGTMFLNRNDQIDTEITGVMTGILKHMPDVYYGRFDMRVGSWESLRAGKDIRVLEFNGTSSDPAHIYQPGYSLIRAYRDLAVHWKIMARIARQNRQKGHTPVRFRQILSGLIIYFRHKRTN